MKRGPKPVPQAVKVMRGTVQPCRQIAAVDNGFDMVVKGSPPIAPDDLSPEAQVVWMDNVSRAMSYGVNELDSSLFADFCNLTAVINKAWQANEVPPASYLEVKRKLAMQFGLGGPGERSRGGGKTDGAKVFGGNAFSRNGNRPRP
jgi:hypothetical protein